MEEPIKFIDDDEGYLDWIENNQTGFVINAFREKSDLYVIIHKAICRSIKEPSSVSEPNWTTGKYIKICALDKTDLEIWGNENLGGKVKTCEICNP